jgi:hypothetical protein
MVVFKFIFIFLAFCLVNVEAKVNVSSLISNTNSIVSLGIDSRGNYFYINSMDYSIRKIESNMRSERIFAGGSRSEFRNPYALIVDPKDNVIVSDTLHNMIKSISTAGVVTTILGGLINLKDGRLDGQGTFSSFSSPSGLAFDTYSNTLYIADSKNFAIRMMDSEYNVQTIAGGYTGGPGGSDGIGSNAQFLFPFGLAIFSPTNSLYITDRVLSVIRRLDLRTYMVTTIAGALSNSGDVSIGLSSKAGKLLYIFNAQYFILNNFMYIVRFYGRSRNERQIILSAIYCR